MITLATTNGRDTGREEHAKAAIDSALRLRAEIDRFIETWPPTRQPETKDSMAPAFSWAALERQLTVLAASPAQASMAADLVSATRKQARFKPPEMVLREILCLANVLMDDTFRSAPDGEGEMS